MTFKKLVRLLLSVFVLAMMLFACGRAPSNLLRQGQLPLNDFPMFLSDGAAGTIWKLDQDANQTELITGLSDPRGIATDRFNNLYVVEYGNGRLLKVDTKSGDYKVLFEDLSSPSIVAVDSFNEIFVTQDGEQNILRVSDQKIIATYNSIPSALVFGVNDIMVVGLFSENKVFWGKESTSTEVDSPVNAAVDGSGRVFVSQGLESGGSILRFHQQDPGSDGKEVASDLQSPMGAAVDAVGNMYVIEQAGGRVVLVTHAAETFEWTSGFLDPQYLALTKY